MTQRLPRPGGDNGDWGDILNAYLSVSLASDGTLQSGIVTNSKLDSATQSAIAKANSSIQTSQLGVASGVATLNSSSQLTASQLPSSVVSGSSALVAQQFPSADASGGYKWIGGPLNPKAPPYNAYGDGFRIGDASMSSITSPTQLTSGSYTFTTADIGKVITVLGAGASSATLIGTINSVSAGKAVLSSSCLTTVSNATTVFGHDDTAALAAFFSALSSVNLINAHIPSGTYMTSSGLTCPPNASISGDVDTMMVATASMSTLWTGMVTFQRDRSLGNIQLDCNGLAQTGLSLGNFGRFNLRDVKVMNQTQHGVIVGATSGYGCQIRGLYIWRDPTLAVPAGYYGVWFKVASDNEVIGAEIVGADTGIRNDTADNKFSHVHVWGWGNGTSAFPTVCFDDNSIGKYVNCVADTPSTYGYRLRQYGSTIIGGQINVNTSGPDNVVIGVQCDASTTTGLTVVGVSFSGATTSNRLAKAVNYTNLSRAAVFGNTYGNVVTVLADQLQLQGSSLGLQALNSAGTTYFITQGGNKSVELWQGGKLQGFTDNGSTQTLNLDASIGTIAPRAAVTGSRPSASTAGAGAMFYDTTLSKPIWSDGTTWRDATGTTV